MKNIVSLIVNDFRNIFRDDILKILLFVPVLMILLVRFGLPPLIDLVPEMIDYQFLIITLFSLIIASFPAFIISFIMLDEKDEGIFIVYKVLPLSAIKFFIYRLGFVIIFSWFFSLLLLIIQKSIALSIWQMIMAALLFSLLPPVLSLVTVTFAQNKIEGVTLMKFLNFILFLPAAAFFIQPPWKYAFGIIPAFWSYQIMEIPGNVMMYCIYFVTGVFIHLLTLYLVFRIFIRKIQA